MAQSQAADAYRDIQLTARVGAADRHGLIQLLFDELGAALAQAEAACQRGDRDARARAAARALSILAGLSASLNTERGGEVAGLLGAVYARASADLIAAARSQSADDYRQIALQIADIADAWRLIGSRT